MQSRFLSLVLLDQILDLLFLVHPHLEQLQILLVLRLFYLGELLLEVVLLPRELVDLGRQGLLLLLQQLLLLLLLVEVLAQLCRFFLFLLSLLHHNCLDTQLQSSHPPLLTPEAGLVVSLLFEFALEVLVGVLHCFHLFLQLLPVILDLFLHLIFHLAILGVRLLDLLLVVLNVSHLVAHLFIQLIGSILCLSELRLASYQFKFLGVQLLLNLLICLFELAFELDSLSLFILQFKMNLFVILLKELGHVVRVFGLLLRYEPLLNLCFELPFNVPD